MNDITNNNAAFNHEMWKQSPEGRLYTALADVHFDLQDDIREVSMYDPEEADRLIDKSEKFSKLADQMAALMWPTTEEEITMPEFMPIQFIDPQDYVPATRFIGTVDDPTEVLDCANCGETVPVWDYMPHFGLCTNCINKETPMWEPKYDDRFFTLDEGGADLDNAEDNNLPLINFPEWKGVGEQRAVPVLVTGAGAPRTNLPTGYHLRDCNCHTPLPRDTGWYPGEEGPCSCSNCQNCQIYINKSEEDTTMNENSSIISTVATRMNEALIELTHLKGNGHEVVQDGVNQAIQLLIKVIKNELTLNEEQDGTGDMATADWYALLRDTEEMADQVEVQVSALSRLNDAFTLRA